MGMLLMTTQDELAGYEITETLGLVRGNTVRARHLGRDFAAAFRNIVGGEIPEYSQLMSEAREEAIQRMLESAEDRGAQAVVAIRFETADIMSSAAEVLIYGTAVRIREKV